MPPRDIYPAPGSIDAALETPDIDTSPNDRYAAASRNWQGIPTIERAADSRLWVSWYSGGVQEDNDNYCLLVTSDDNGQTFSEPVAVIDPKGMTRAWDPCLWNDPTGRLWWTWTQSCPMRGEAWDGRGGVWASVADDPANPNTSWSTPQRIFHGVALNKPIFLDSGEWILPVAIWWFFEQFKQLDAIRKPGVIVSSDQGASWTWRGGVDLEDRVFDEPMVVQQNDGTLWMLIRTRKGIAESFSMDGGISWSVARPSNFSGPSSRFHFRRLRSGRLLLVNHLGNPDRKRSHLTAMLSDDDGLTWPHRLLLDEREQVTYPDVTEDVDGRLYFVYDHNRYSDREILFATLCEDDIIAGQLSTPESKLKVLLNKAG